MRLFNMRILLATVSALLACLTSADAGFSQIQPVEQNSLDSVPPEVLNSERAESEVLPSERNLPDSIFSEVSAAESLKPALCPAIEEDTEAMEGLSLSSLASMTRSLTIEQPISAENPLDRRRPEEPECTPAVDRTSASAGLPNPEPAGVVASPETASDSQPEVATPLQRPPTRLFNLETANQLPAGALLLFFGSHQTIPDDSFGTGNQLYYGGIQQGITDSLQVGLSGQVYDDPPAQSINGQSPNITLLSLATSLKYRLVETDQLSLALQGSIELLSLSSLLFDSGSGEGLRVVGSVHAPITYTASPNLQFHITPGVTFLPGSLNDNELYGTLFTLGTGVNWRPAERWLVYSTLNLHDGPAGKTIEREQSNGRQPVWALGTRYNVTPKTGIDLYATNGLGVTPATETLTSIPDGEELLIGVALNYTPGLGYRSSFRETSSASLSERDYQLTNDGITLTTASTLQPGNIALIAGAGTDDNYRLGVAYSPDEYFQIEAIVEDFSSSNATVADTAGDTLRYMVGGRLQLLDQRQGDPVSLSARILGGRDTDQARTTGVLFIDLPITYQISSRTALFFNPKVAAFGENTRFGLGVGINYEVDRGWQLIGEITPVFNGSRTVWALGSRYSFPKTAVDIDLYATNAAGRTGLGTLVGQSEVQVGAGLRWVFAR